MSEKAKKGLGYIITAVLFAIVGVVTWTVGDMPTAVTTLITVVAAIAAILNIVIVVPNVT